MGDANEKIEKNQPLFKIPRLVPELGGLGYFVKYPSPSSSGTKLGK